MNDSPVSFKFALGDPVVLARGTYEGTRGVFFRMNHDVKWGEVTEANGKVRSHPIAWLAHFPEPPAPLENGVPGPPEE